MAIPNKSPLKILEKNGAWAYPGTVQIFWVPPIISGTGKATDFKFGEYIYRANANKNFGEKGEWVYPRAAQIFWVPPIISGTGKATDFKFCRTLIGSIGTKAHKNFGNSSRGHSQRVPKIFRAPTCRAHCAVIFAIAQLSHEVPH